MSVFNSSNLCQTFEYYQTRFIKYLPSSVPIKEGQAYLWVDSNRVEGNMITLYIINNSDEILHYNGYQLAAIQQEYKNNSKKWCRSESFFYGWCGTPYIMDVTIQPGLFYTTREKYIAGDKKYEIRYTFYGTEIKSSNIIWGTIDTNEAELAKYDDIAYKFCDSDYLIKVIREMPKPYKTVPAPFISRKNQLRDTTYIIENYNKEIVKYAIIKLCDLFPETATKVLTIIANNENHPLAEFIKEQINYIKSNK